MIWVVQKQAHLTNFELRGLQAYSLEKDRYFIRLLGFFAKYHFSDGGWFMGPYITLFSKSFNFWHGIPLKKILYDFYKFKERSRLKKWLIKRNAKRLFMVNSSKYALSFMQDVYRFNAFKIPLVLGQPRIQPLLATPDDLMTKHDAFIVRLREERTRFDAIYTYAPTFRENGTDYLKELHLDLSKLNAVLKGKNALMVFKLHPLCNLESKADHTNIRFADKATDIYLLLAMTDTLITDYSSLYFDFLVCESKKIILLQGDLSNYQQHNRAVYEAHLADMRTGLILNDFTDLMAFISGAIDYEPPTTHIRNKYWSEAALNGGNWMDCIDKQGKMIPICSIDKV